MSTNASPFSEVEMNGKARSSQKKSKHEKGLIAGIVILAIVLVAFIIAVIVLAFALKASKKSTTNDICTTEGCLETAVDFLQTINTDVDPCDDFYEFSCGKYIDSDREIIGRFEEAGTRMGTKLHENIFQAAMANDTPGIIKKIALAYRVCSLYGAIKDEDIPWLRQVLQEVGGWPMMDINWDEKRYPWEVNYAKAVKRLDVQTPIHFMIELNYFNTKQNMIHISQHYTYELVPLDKEKILAIAKKIGNRVDDSKLEEEFKEVEDFVEKLQKIARDSQDLHGDLNEIKSITVANLDNDIKSINWLEFLNTIFGEYLNTPLTPSEPIIVIGFDYIRKVSEMLFHEEISKRTLANYLAANFIQSLISIDGKMANFKTARPLTESVRPADVSEPEGFSGGCYSLFTTKASPAIDYIYRTNRKEGLISEKTFDDIFNAMRDIIKENTWMDKETKSAATEKMEAMNRFSGYTDVSKDLRKIEEYFRGLPNFTDNALSNAVEIKRFSFKRQVQKLRATNDRNAWPDVEGIYAPLINAMNSAERNVILIPAGIQSFPVFVANRPNFWTYGALGFVLGHEINHSFDTDGIYRDKYGNIRNWWKPETKEEFDRRAKCLIDQYDKCDLGYKGHHVNGTQTINDNIADNNGLRTAYRAYKKWVKENGEEKRLPGLEKYTPEQLFFVAVNMPWCTKRYSPEEGYNRALHDEHAPNKFRVAGSAVNLEGFGKAFNCKLGSKMNPVKKCSMW